MAKQKITEVAPVGAPSLQFIPLLQISPSKLNPRKTFNEDFINELAESIKKVGLIQPITVRPDADGYEIICGEQRYRASQIAGLTTLPASVRNMTDTEAMELMITENLQRKDVHPLEEAEAFLYMRTKMGYELADVAAKIGKDERFVVRRLQLLSLVPELKKIFSADSLSIGHAELLSRIDKQNQLLWFKDKYSRSWDGGQGTINGLKEWLSNKTENKLSDAKFKTTQPYEGKEYVSAVCTNCRLNSSVNHNLFPDTADKAVCHGPQCFQAKTNAQFTIELQKAIDDPKVVLVNSSYGGAEEITKKLKGDGLTVMKYDQFNQLNKYNDSKWAGESDEDFEARKKLNNEKYQEKKSRSVKAFDIYTGKYQTVTLSSTGAPVDGKQGANRATLVADIEQKRKRGRELDREKLMKNLVGHISSLPQLSSAYNPELSVEEINAITCMCYEKCSSDAIRKALGIPKNTYSYDGGEKILEAIAKADIGLKLMVIRNGLFTTFNSIYPNGISGAVTFHLANDWCEDAFNELAKAQDAIKEKREAKLDQKLKAYDEQPA